MEPMTLVLVKWRDASRHDHVHIDEIDELHTVEVETAGFLYDMDESQIKLVNGTFDDGHGVGTLYCIPMDWMMSIRPLVPVDETPFEPVDPGRFSWIEEAEAPGNDNVLVFNHPIEEAC